MNRKSVLKHTKETAAALALKYTNRRSFCVGSSGAYLAATKNGWIDDICRHMTAKRVKVTYEEIAAAALLYKSRSEWEDRDVRTYGAARRRGILEEVSPHMINKRSGGENEIFNIIKEIYPDAKTLRIKNNDKTKYPLDSYEIDIYIPSIRKGVEFDGKYWHSQKMLEKTKKLTPELAARYHEDKDSFFKDHGIEVVHVKELEWYRNKSFVTRMLTDFIGATSPVPPQQRHNFYRRCHWGIEE